MEPTVADIVTAPADRPRTDGRLDISVIAADGVTAVSDLYQRSPLRGMFPEPEMGEAPLAVLANTSGGVVGGDELKINLVASEHTALTVTGQAAEKVYRSAGPEAMINTTITAADGAVLEYLPQGTILFDGARFRRVTTINAAPGSRVMAGEVLTLGRVERGERFASGLLHDEWRVNVGERLAWADALHLSDESGRVLASALESPAGFDGCPAYATFVCASDDALNLVEIARELQSGRVPDVKAGVTAFDGVLVARWLGRDPAAVRAAFGAFWSRFRAETCGKRARLPTIWNI